MERLRLNCLPQLPTHLFQLDPGYIKLLHINIGNIHRKMVDIKCDDLVKSAYIICINETHLLKTDPLDSNMLNLGDNMEIYCKDRDIYSGGVAVIINKKLQPQEICNDTMCELVSLRISAPQEIYIICVYRSPSMSICTFAKEMNEIIKLFEGSELCIVGDINGDVSLLENRMCFSLFRPKRLYQLVTKPTCDSGTLIDHVYTRRTLQIKTDVSDC